MAVVVAAKPQSRRHAEPVRCMTCIYWRPTSELLGVCSAGKKPVTKTANQSCNKYVHYLVTYRPQD